MYSSYDTVCNDDNDNCDIDNYNYFGDDYYPNTDCVMMLMIVLIMNTVIIIMTIGRMPIIMIMLMIALIMAIRTN